MGFYIGLTGREPNANDYSTNNTPLDGELYFAVWTTGGRERVFVPAKPEYAYQIELLDTNGVAIPKTERGKNIGNKFFDVDANASKNGILIHHLRADKKGQLVEMPILFYPNHVSDFFMVEKPGNYKLLIKFQILAFNTKKQATELIRFPPLEYPLVK